MNEIRYLFSGENTWIVRYVYFVPQILTLIDAGGTQCERYLELRLCSTARNETADSAEVEINIKSIAV